ncbi:MAG: radical SAM family heme chaperone HemW [Planctomycetes bacterium]|nr:radical SAM family heme chaperone HemW [Planctomycetota bacterium]
MQPSLYIHIPFCVKKCGYCDFYSGVAGDADIDRYIAALDRELALMVPQGLAPATVFIGGGTPTRLSAGQLQQLGQVLGRHLDLSAGPEFTCEINPATLTPAKAKALAQMGVNRASMGVQSFDPHFLRELDRAHEAGTAEAAIAMAREAGIARLSVDLMFALPGQTLPQFEADLRQALALGTSHVSLYALTFEDDTTLTRKLQLGQVQPCPEDLERAMFEAAGRICGQAGLHRYEVSNFAVPGQECRHNLVYWTLGDWIGIGAGAHGMLDGTITANPKDFRAWCEALEAGRLAAIGQSAMRPQERAEALLLMGLRLVQGVELARFRAFAGADFTALCGQAAGRLVELGLLEFTPTHVRCTEQGLLVLDSVVVELASDLEVRA